MIFPPETSGRIAEAVGAEHSLLRGPITTTVDVSRWADL